MVAAHSERATIAYARVSSEDQVRYGVSLDAQKARLRAFAVGTGRELTDVVVDDGQSAKTLARPGLRRILEGVRRREIGAVIVLKLDRLTRSVRDLGELLELFSRNDTALVSVSESLDTASAAGRLMVNVLGSVAQWEREAIAERTAFALAHKRRNGQVYGSTPFGYDRVENKLVPIAAEQRVLAKVRTLAGSGSSLRQIGRELTRLGVKTKSGNATWCHTSVASLLHSKTAEISA